MDQYLLTVAGEGDRHHHRSAVVDADMGDQGAIKDLVQDLAVSHRLLRQTADGGSGGGARRRAQRIDQASVSTDRRICSISSNSV